MSSPIINHVDYVNANNIQTQDTDPGYYKPGPIAKLSDVSNNGISTVDFVMAT
ncbi:hypothetical protein PENANT_c004G04894 [Penicillium antarcticum]|uniref:Uncharacterized protein n=1 Tax=Penicillium antarcticum TaxID=416450 RepID=A0A1V6QFZ4_9EURO|nr:hypothetical protein PENANT_c004G04894 [Penicillium antarcticum]